MAPRIVDREQKTRQIIEQAMVVFARAGYNATTMEAIAASAGIGKGTVYEYFKSKQELFLACFDAYMAQYCEALEAQSEPSGGAAFQIRNATSAAFDLADEMEELFPLTFEFWAASASLQIRDRVMDLFRKTYAQLRELDRKSTRLNSSHIPLSRMPSSA